MRILQITTYFFPAMTFGGPVRCTYNLSKYLAKQGHEVTVFTTDALNINNDSRIEKTHQVIDNFDVFYFRSLSRSFGFFITPASIKALEKKLGSFDIVHLHEYRTFQNLAYYYMNAKRTPYVITLHGQLFTSYVGDNQSNVTLRKIYDSLYGRNMLKRANKILALTEAEAKKCTSIGVNPKNIAVIPNGVDPSDFLNIPKPDQFKRQFNFTEDMVLYVGRVNKRKGVDVLIKAYSELAKHRENTKLVIVGADDGFMLEGKIMAKTLGVEDKVLFTGGLSREEVLAAYNDSSVVVYAGVQEGFPLVPLEAGIMGKPVIVSDDPGSDFVRKGEFGLTVKYGDTDQLADALKLILDNPGLAQSMGSNGKAVVTANYNWESIGKQIEQTYYNIINQRNKPP
jgi:glycosyltransferase involved in cell wall biosynthesis